MQNVQSINNHNVIPKKCFNSVIYISFVILFFQAITNTEMGIVSQFTHQSGEGWVGPLSTSLLFLGSGIASIQTRYISKCHYKYNFFIGSLGYTLFIGLAVIFLHIGFSTVVQVLILIGSFISGCTVSLFYNSQFNYVNTCSQIDNQKTKYFGISMCIVQSANIVGNFISALLIEPVGQNNYAIIMNISVFIVSLFFLGVKDYKYSSLPTKNQIVNYHEQELHKQIQDNGELSLIQKSFFQFPLRINLIFCFSGIMISFIFCQLSVVFYDTFNDIYQKQELNRITFIAFIIQGVGELLGGLSVVFGQDIITKRIGLSITYILITLLFILSLIMFYFASQWKSLALLQVASFIAGYCDCMGFALSLSIAGKWQQKGMGWFNIAQSGTVAITSLMIAFIKFDYILLWCILVFVLSSFVVISERKNVDNNEQEFTANQSLKSED